MSPQPQVSAEDQAAFEAMAREADQGRADGQPASQQPAKAPPPVASAGPSAPPKAPPADHMGEDYQGHKDAIDAQSAFEQMQAEAKQGGQGAAQAAEATPVAGGAATPQPGQPRTRDNWIPGAPMIYDSGKHMYVPDPNVHPGGLSITDIASDVGRGLLETPKMAVVKGPRDAIESMLDGAADFSRWIESKLPKGIADLDTLAPAHLPDVAGPTTATGSVVKNVSQFITSMNVVGKALQGAQLPSAIKGAAALFAGFEGKQGRLSDLVQEVPELRNPVTDFLSSKPGDSEALGRLKNAVEGLGLGQLAEGLVKGIRLLKNGTDAQTAVDTAGQQAAEKTPIGPEVEHEAPPGEEPAAQPAKAVSPAAPKPSALTALGDPAAPPDAPLVSLQATKQRFAERAVGEIEPGQAIKAAEPATPEELAGPAVPGATEAQAKEPVFHVNFARIDGPDDVKRVLSEMAALQSDNVDAARRGVQTFEQTRLGAATKDAFQILMDRRVGQPLNDQEMLAARQLEYQSANTLSTALYAAADDPSPENVLAYRKMMTTHAMISAEVRGAQTEIARAQSAQRIRVGPGDAVERMRAVMQQIDSTGGMKANLEDLYRTKQLFDANDLTTLNNVAEKSIYARTRDALLNAWTNGLVSGPLTHVKVNLSNMATIALRLTETRIAESLDRLWGAQDGVVAGETAQTTAGLVQGIKDSFRYVNKLMTLPGEARYEAEPSTDNAVANAIEAYKTGRYNVGTLQNAWGETMESQLASDSIHMSDSGWLGNGMDLLQQVVRAPGRALTAEHQFYKSIGMRMELNRFAIRQASEELNAGQISQDAFQGRIAELVENPPPALMDKAIGGETYQTFTDAPGKLAETIEKIRTDFPLTRAIIPFYKIPSRMLSFGFERSPLAPLMSSFRQNIAAGGARQSMALAQMGLGTAVMLATADSVLNGTVTGRGPLEKGKRQTMENEGWLPYSIKIGDRWVQYNRLETIGSSMSMAADAVETIRDYQSAVNTDDPDIEKLSVATALAIANDVTSKSYLQGIANFFATMANPREGGEAALKSLAGSAVPGAAAWVAKLQDPYDREVVSMTDAIRARTPGASEGLAPMRNLWGEPISHESGLGKAYDALAPFASRQSQDEPIDREITRLGMNATLPPATTTIHSAKVNLKENPAQYSRYVELAGNEIKDPLTGQGTKDTLNALVTGSHPLSALYNMRQDEGKEIMIQDIIRAQRERAKEQLLQEYPDLKEKVDGVREKQQQLKSLVSVGG